MYIYAGIDEAGYGPMFGPLLVSRMVMGIPGLEPGDDNTQPPRMWQRLSAAVCKSLSSRKRGRIPVNDSKKLYTPASGLRHLELSVLTFAGAAGHRPATVDQWLDCLGEDCHHDLNALPWYEPTDDHPWASLPCTVTAGEVAIARSMLTKTADRIGVQMLDLSGSVVFEDRFNEMVSATRSKSAASFTFVAGHLRSIWDRFGHHHPTVAVDRQSGRTRYRELLAMTFPNTQLRVFDESPTASRYHIQALSNDHEPARSMYVRFEVEADSRHMPVALASMISKYTRELMMIRFKTWFAQHAPQIKPTAGYGSDAKRFWQQLQPILPELSIAPEKIKRRC